MLQTCFLAISGVLPREEAVQRIKAMIEKTYGRRAATSLPKTSPPSTTLAHLSEVSFQNRDQHFREAADRVAVGAGLSSRGSLPRSWPVAAMPCQSAPCPLMAPFPLARPTGKSATSRMKFRSGETDLCIQCGQCALACPHSVIRARFYDERKLADPKSPRPRPSSLRTGQCAGLSGQPLLLAILRRGLHGMRDLCRVRPAHSPRIPGTKAINMAAKARC